MADDKQAKSVERYANQLRGLMEAASAINSAFSFTAGQHGGCGDLDT